MRKRENVKSVKFSKRGINQTNQRLTRPDNTAVSSSQPMHGYEIITKIRKNFGVYFGPSTVYPLLNTLEKKGFVKSEWNMNTERPRKIYSLTNNGQNMLNFTEESLNMICRKITVKINTDMTLDPSTHLAVNIIAKGDRSAQTNRLTSGISEQEN